MSDIQQQRATSKTDVTLSCLFFTFLYVGGTAIGISVLQNTREMVLRKALATESEFSDALAVVQTYPGPMMVNTATFIGYIRRGIAGATVCFVGFTLPSTLLMLLLAALYQKYGAMPQVNHWVTGLNAVITGVLLNITLDMGRRHLEKRWQLISAGGVALLSAAGFNQSLMIFAGLITGAFLLRRGKTEKLSGNPIVFSRYYTAIVLGVILTTGLLASFWSKTLIGEIYSAFLYVGSIAFGNGVTILPVMRDVVMGRGWVTPTQFGTAVAFGQITPGPILSSATFIGYIAEGWMGGLTATFAIYAPSFVMTLVVAELFDHIKHLSAIKGAIQGAMIAFFGMLLGFSWYMSSQYLHSLNDVIAASIVFIALSYLKMSTIPAVLTAAALWALLDSLV